MVLGLSSSSLCLAWLTLLVGSVLTFEYSAYCTNMCMYGQGGNLCKCSAVHFAGKRMVVGARASARVTKELDQEDMSEGLPQSLETAGEGPASDPLSAQAMPSGDVLASWIHKLAQAEDKGDKASTGRGSESNFRQSGLLSDVIQKYLQSKAAPKEGIPSWSSARDE